MYIKTKFTVFLLVASLVMSSPLAFVQAYDTTSEQERATLLFQIERLMAEVSRLQAVLSSRTTVTSSLVTSNYTPYQTVYFPLRFESIYLVENGELFNLEGGSEVDKGIFTLLSKVLGDSVIENQIQEFRIFNDNRSDLGAFVEKISSGNKWVVGVNRAGFDFYNAESNKIFADLFIHEYAHILMYEDMSVVSNFEEEFWTKADFEHSAVASSLSDSTRFSYLNKYYSKNTSRFVSDYATINPEEDVAESFVTFVSGGVPTGSMVKDKKILSFYKNSIFTEARLKLRNNLLNLNLLR